MDFPKPQQEAMDEFARVHLKTCIITGGVLREFNLFVTCISTHIIPGTNDYFYSHSRKVLQHVSPNGHTHINTLSQQPRNFVNSVTCPAFYFQFYFKCNRFILSNNRCAGSCFIRAALRNQGTPLLGLGAILVPAIVGSNENKKQNIRNSKKNIHSKCYHQTLIQKP